LCNHVFLSLCNPSVSICNCNTVHIIVPPDQTFNILEIIKCTNLDFSFQRWMAIRRARYASAYVCPLHGHA
jgi:hypothetical protein